MILMEKGEIISSTGLYCRMVVTSILTVKRHHWRKKSQLISYTSGNEHQPDAILSVHNLILNDSGVSSAMEPPTCSMGFAPLADYHAVFSMKLPDKIISNIASTAPEGCKP